MIFNFWKPKPPEEFLGKIVTRLEHIADHKKLALLKKKLPDIKSAIEKYSLAGSHDYDIEYDDLYESLSEAEEVALNYLYWHSEIFETLPDEDHIFITSADISPAAEYFLKETEADAINAFQAIFERNPLLAILSLTPLQLFKPTILNAMKTLTEHEDPALYFICYADIHSAYSGQDLEGLTEDLIDLTVLALDNMLLKDPESLLFPHCVALADGEKRRDYLSYLPNGMLRENFIKRHAATIEAAFAALAENTTENHIKDRKLILSEHVKICFQAAAIGDTTSLTEHMQTLDKGGSDEVYIYSHYVGLPYLRDGKDSPVPEPFNPDPFTPVFELIRLTNPLASTDAKDENLGAHSKYLWMIRRDDTVLASTFAKSAMTDYLKDQNELGSITCPTAQDWESFLYESPKPPEKIDLVFE